MRLESRRIAGAVLAAVVAVAWAGCAGRSQDRPAPAEITVTTIDEQDLAGAVERHRGRVVLVDFWATWCGACVEMFPHTVQLHRDLGGRGLAVLTVSLDSPRDEAKVRDFLVEQKATTENFQSRFGASSESIDRFEIPSGTIPVVRLYDRAGKLREEFSAADGEIAPEEIDRALERLLAENP
jgi:thiol-disulfide isomerase/thioredoxin